MKARTRFSNGENRCEIFFAYEDYGGSRYKSYEEAKRKGRRPLYLMGYLYSHYWGSTEEIDEVQLIRRPTTSQVKRFITHCKDVILND